MKCFYHRADLDGQCSGAIVKSRFPHCEMIGIQYGDAFPWDRIEPDETVVMTDFSLSMDEMERLSGACVLVWIDHHKSAIETARAKCFLASGAQVLETGLAACELTWRWCFDTEPCQAVFWLGRYDVWDHHNHPGALAFQYGMRNLQDTSPDNQSLWQGLFHDDVVSCGLVERIAQEGRGLLTYETRQNAKYAASCAFEVDLDGRRAIAINKGLTNSLLFKEVYDPDRHDCMVSFVRRAKGWTVSVYSDKPAVDASAICSARGGGGHHGAAGFQCDVLPF